MSDARRVMSFCFFFFNETATTEIYTLPYTTLFRSMVFHGGCTRTRRRQIMRRPFTGCGTALVTPFRSDGSLDEAGVSRLAKRQIDAGIHFLVPCGTTGEVPTLTDEEQVRVVELVVAEA